VATDTESEFIAKVKERFKEAQDWENENRLLHVEDTRFENGRQWSEEEILDRGNRPTLTINKTAAAVKQIVNDSKQNRFSIKVRPVDDTDDVETAKILTGLIRNIETSSNARDAYDLAHQQAVTGGYGYFRILTDYEDNSFDQVVKIERMINPLSVYMDPEAKKADRSDAEWVIISDEMSKEAFEEAYPEAHASSVETGRGDDKEWTSVDKVRVAEIYEVMYEKRKLVYVGPKEGTDAVAAVSALSPEEAAQITPMVHKTMHVGSGKGQLSEEMYERLDSIGFIAKDREVEARKIVWHKISGSAILEGPTDVVGKYIPIVPVLGEEVWIEGKCHLRSAIRHAKDPQRLYNWSRSNAVETIALAPRQPWILTKEQIEGHEEQWNSAYREAKPYLVVNETPSGSVPQRLQPSMPDAGALREAMQAADDIKATTGIYDASLGARGNETSGRAIRERKTQGDISNLTFSDNLKRGIEHCARILIDIIPKIYDTERVVRLLNVDGSEGWVKINVPDPMTGRLVNDISIGRYDVVVNAGPAYNTKRLEAADGMIQLIQAAPQYAPIIVPRLAKNLDFPEAAEIGEEMKQMNQGSPEQAKMQQMIQDLTKKLEAEKNKNNQALEKLAVQSELKGDELALKEELEKERIAIEREELDLKRMEIQLNARNNSNKDSNEGGD
jgi:hypothetical protein